MHKHKYRTGFTIVELLVVIVVIGILAAITIVSFTGVSQKAVAASLQSDLSGASTKLKMYQVENGTYPTELSGPGGDNTYCPLAPVVDDRYCFKLSPTNSEESYYSDGTTFKLILGNDAIKYQITESGPPDLAADITFVKSYGGTVTESNRSFIQTSDGGFAITGGTSSYGAGSTDMFIAKYNSYGVLSWFKTWGSTGGDYGSSIIQTSDGNFVVAGYSASFGLGSNDIFIVKYTSDGTLSWDKVWGGPASDTASSLVQTSDGGFILTGNTVSYGQGSNDIIIAKYTSDGTMSWIKSYGGPSGDVGTSIVQTGDGGFVLAGDTPGVAGSGDVMLAKYNSDGTQSWITIWGDASSESSNSLIKTNDGGFAVAGRTSSYGAGNYDAFLAKYTSDGTLSWIKTWGSTALDNAQGVIQTNDDGFIIAGSTYSFGAGGNESFVAKYTSTGALVWSKTLGGTGNDSSSSIVGTNDGGFATAGGSLSYSSGGNDIFLARYTSQGIINSCNSPICQVPGSVAESSPSPVPTSPSLTYIDLTGMGTVIEVPASIVNSFTPNTVTVIAP